jgi:hypothetical protein
MPALRTRALLSATTISVVLGISAGPAAASSWAIALKAGSAGEAKAQAAPAPPTSTSAVCVSSALREVAVTWSAVAHSTSYSVYDSTTTSSGSYAAVATGVSGTSWTSTTLSAANYWFEVTAYVGTKWVSAKSSATGETTISASGTECTQP